MVESFCNKKANKVLYLKSCSYQTMHKCPWQGLRGLSDSQNRTCNSRCSICKDKKNLQVVISGLCCNKYRVYTFPQLAGQTRLSGQTRLVDYRTPRLHCPSSRIRLASLLARAGQIWPIPIMLREYYGASSFICHAFPRASLSALLLAL